MKKKPEKLKLYDDTDGRASPAFSGLAGKIVRAIDPETEADPVSVLIIFLICYGNILGNSAYFSVSGRKHAMRLFAVLTGSTGSGKGMALSAIEYVMRKVDPDWAEHRIQRGLSSGEGLIEAVRDPIYQDAPKKSNVDSIQRMIIDAGVEDKRLLVFEEEFVRVLQMMKRHGNILSSVLRELFDTGNVSTLTMHSRKATDADVALVGCITPEELRSTTNMIDIYNGLYNRFLWPLVRKSKLLPSGGNLEKINLNEIISEIKDAVDFGKHPQEIVFTDEAYLEWEDVYKNLATLGETGTLGALNARATTLVRRLASIYALLDQTNKIGVNHLNAALCLWKYCYESSQIIFDSHQLSSKESALIKELKMHGASGLTKTEIRDYFHRNLDKKNLDGLVDHLISSGYVKLEKMNREPGEKGRPATRLVFNQSSNDLNDKTT